MAMNSKRKTELCLAYIGVLGLSAIKVMAGKSAEMPSRLLLETDPDLVEKDGADVMFETFWFSKAHHAELVLTNCCEDLRALGADRPDGWFDLPAATVRDSVVNAAAGLGAGWRTTAQITESANETVGEVERHVAALNTSGGLASFNSAYKSYRLAMQETGEPAMNYAAYLHGFKLKMVRRIGENVAAGVDKFAGLASVVPGSVFARTDRFNDSERSKRVYVNRGWSNHSFRKAE